MDHKLLNENLKWKINSVEINYIYLFACIIYVSFKIKYMGIRLFIYEDIKYFSHWGYIFNIFYAILKVVNKKNNKFMDIFFNVTSNVEIMICLLYWLILIPLADLNEYELHDIILGFSIHLYPLIYVLAEYIIDKSIKFKYSNFLYIILFLSTYELNELYFTYYLKDPPYPFVKQRQLYFIVIIAVSILLHFILTFIKSKIFKNSKN